MILKKNKKPLVFFLATSFSLLSFFVFLFYPETAIAAGFDWNQLNPLTWAGNAFLTGVKSLLYGLFVLEGWIASMAFALFNWAVNPKYVTLFFNLDSIYEMWKFVRDFFNLFFILVLLFTAFAIIFQIQKYNNKKIIMQLVIAALLVNFSFPISRMIIDATNVPMYFFAQQMGGSGPNGVFGSTLSASGLQDILIPGAGGTGKVDFKEVEVTQLLLAIIFMFLFSITLLILAILFIIRLMALLILVVFSSAGFVAGLIPGMEKFSGDWWKNFMKYALFGPAAMFMLLLATRFFAEIATVDLGLEAAASGASINGMEQVIAKMALFTIPIIMLWMAMGVSNSFSIAGSSKVVGWGKGVANWGRRQAVNVGKAPFRPIATRAKAAGEGVKKGLNKGQLFGLKYGNTPVVGKYLKGQTWKEGSEAGAAKWRGRVYGGGEGVKSELEKLHDKRVYEKVKENKDNNVSRSALLKDLDSKDAIEKQAAALSLAENGDITTDESLEKAIAALTTEIKKKDGSVEVKIDNDKLLRVLDKAKDEAVGEKAYKRLADNPEMYKRNEAGEFERDDDGNRKPGELLDKINGKLKKDGNIKVRIDEEIAYNINNRKDDESVAQAQQKAFDNTIGKLSADDLAKQGSVHSALEKGDEVSVALRGYLKQKSDNDVNYFQEAMKKMKQADREKWYNAGIGSQSQGGGGERRRPFRPGMHASDQ